MRFVAGWSIWKKKILEWWCGIVVWVVGAIELLDRRMKR